jgi:hypothetical protein
VDHPIPGQVVVGIKTADVDAAAKAIEASGGGIVKGLRRRPRTACRGLRQQGQRPGFLQAAGPVNDDAAAQVGARASEAMGFLVDAVEQIPSESWD